MFRIFIVLLAFMFLATPAVAGSKYKVPKDAIIKVFNKDGRQIGEMSRKEYKVIKIKKRIKVTTCTISHKPHRKHNRKHHAAKPASKNTIIFHAGGGKTGIRVLHTAGMYTVREQAGVVGGLTYCRNFSLLGICASAFTNESYLLGVKLDF